MFWDIMINVKDSGTDLIVSQITIWVKKLTELLGILMMH